MIVRVVRRIDRAISFGVFCRDAPSTSAIIRSMKVSPGLQVTRTTIRSESTVVPPVTAHRSPPDSRMTGRRLAGDRRLVDGRDALDDVTVARDDLTGLDDDVVAEEERGAGHLLLRAVLASRRAVVSVRVRRSVSAWALPRPSATASARLAKSTVAHSHTVTQIENTGRVEDGQHRGEHRADPDDEDDRAARQVAGVELGDGRGQVVPGGARRWTRS